MDPGALVDIDIEKPAAGGRMLGRHHGQVVLVWGAIPGERVQARIERVAKGVVYAETIDVLSASADRRAVGGDWRCGGNVLAHVSYPRQLQIKGQIVQDALGRIGRVPLPTVPEVIGSPEQGYRMRARLHVRDGRIGFYREGTHELCDAGATGQLLPATIAWMAAAERVLARREVRLKPDTTHETHETHGGGGIAAIELAENIAGDERACHLELHAGVEPSSFASLGDGLTGLSAQRADRRAGERLAGTPAITDVIRVAEGDGAPTLRLRRDVRAFFQSNRFLLERLVQHVAALVPSGPVVDLYAGVGLFGLSLATAGAEAVTLVEGDPVSSADLRTNAEPFAGRVRVTRQSVEAYVAQEHGRGTADETFIVDPPRTGMSKDALAGTIAAAPRRIVYVSCDVATLARDTRTLLDAGYALEQITGIDLFPNTAHVESVALFTR